MPPKRKIASSPDLSPISDNSHENSSSSGTRNRRSFSGLSRTNPSAYSGGEQQFLIDAENVMGAMHQRMLTQPIGDLGGTEVGDQPGTTSEHLLEGFPTELGSAAAPPIYPPYAAFSANELHGYLHDGQAGEVVLYQDGEGSQLSNQPAITSGQFPAHFFVMQGPADGSVNPYGVAHSISGNQLNPAFLEGLQDDDMEGNVFGDQYILPSEQSSGDLPVVLGTRDGSLIQRPDVVSSPLDQRFHSNLADLYQARQDDQLVTSSEPILGSNLPHIEDDLFNALLPLYRDRRVDPYQTRAIIGDAFANQPGTTSGQFPENVFSNVLGSVGDSPVAGRQSQQPHAENSAPSKSFRFRAAKSKERSGGGKVSYEDKSKQAFSLAPRHPETGIRDAESVSSPAPRRPAARMPMGPDAESVSSPAPRRPETGIPNAESVSSPAPRRPEAPFEKPLLPKQPRMEASSSSVADRQRQQRHAENPALPQELQFEAQKPTGYKVSYLNEWEQASLEPFPSQNPPDVQNRSADLPDPLANSQQILFLGPREAPPDRYSSDLLTNSREIFREIGEKQARDNINLYIERLGQRYTDLNNIPGKERLRDNIMQKIQKLSFWQNKETPFNERDIGNVNKLFSELETLLRNPEEPRLAPKPLEPWEQAFLPELPSTQIGDANLVPVPIDQVANLDDTEIEIIKAKGENWKETVAQNVIANKKFTKQLDNAIGYKYGSKSAGPLSEQEATAIRDQINKADNLSNEQKHACREGLRRRSENFSRFMRPQGQQEAPEQRLDGWEKKLAEKLIENEGFKDEDTSRYTKKEKKAIMKHISDIIEAKRSDLRATIEEREKLKKLKNKLRQRLHGRLKEEGDRGQVQAEMVVL